MALATKWAGRSNEPAEAESGHARRSKISTRSCRKGAKVQSSSRRTQAYERRPVDRLPDVHEARRNGYRFRWRRGDFDDDWRRGRRRTPQESSESRCSAKVEPSRKALDIAGARTANVHETRTAVRTAMQKLSWVPRIRRQQSGRHIPRWPAGAWLLIPGEERRQTLRQIRRHTSRHTLRHSGRRAHLGARPAA